MGFVSKNVAEVFKGSCVACGTCTKVCPKVAIKIYKGCHATIDKALCVGCGKCAKACPTGCITVKERNNL